MIPVRQAMAFSEGVDAVNRETLERIAKTLASEVRRLREENDQLKADAERYRFIRLIAHSEAAYEIYQGNRLWFAVYDTERKGFDAAVDNAAIDAARGEK